jgi:hypothetical protein
MNITEILEADKAARLRIKEANALAEQMDTQTPKEANALTEERFLRAQEEISRFENEQTDMANRRIEVTEKQADVHLQRLNRRYEEQGDHWLSYIVSQVTEG